MPNNMADKENLLSLMSIDVLISHVGIDLGIECHLPCVVFRLLDYPAVSIPYFDQWQIDEFHELKNIYPNLSWHQLLSDQFYELRSANGQFKFNRGKSCLFKTYLTTLRRHLLNVPLFMLLIDQTHDRQSSNPNTTHFIASGTVKLDHLIETLHQSIIQHGLDTPLVEQETFRCTLLNLMGVRIGSCELAIRFCHYGTTILTQLPMLDDSLMTKPNVPESTLRVVVEQKESEINQIRSEPPVPLPRRPKTADSVVQHKHVINEKRDVGLQLSRNELPSESIHSKSAQTRWTSTRNRPIHPRSSKGPHISVRDDPSSEDPTVLFYQPPALYFNSDCDFLQTTVPSVTSVVEKNKENRLAYLSSVSISSFDGDSCIEKKTEKPRKFTGSSVRFNLSSTLTKNKKTIPSNSQPAKSPFDSHFLAHFPLLRALVEEALALQQNFPQSNSRTSPPKSSVQQKPTLFHSLLRKTKSQANTKSTITLRRVNSAPRLYPAPSSKSQMTVNKNDVRALVSRLSKPRQRPINQQTFDISQVQPSTNSHTPRLQKTTKLRETTKKLPVTYATNRAHRLFTEFSRSRRVTLENPKIVITKSDQSPTSLLNKVEIDTTALDKSPVQRISSETIPINTTTSIKLSSISSQGTTLNFNQTVTKATFSTPDPVTIQSKQDPNDKNDDLNFSITDITDYFTDGAESSSRPDPASTT